MPEEPSTNGEGSRSGTPKGTQQTESALSVTHHNSRSHRQRKQLHWTSMQQSLDQLTKEIASLKSELEISRTENQILQARLPLHIPLLPAMLHDAFLSPSSSSPSIISAGSPDSLTYINTHSRQTGEDLLHFEQSGPSNREMQYPGSVFRSLLNASDEGAHGLHFSANTHFLGDFASPNQYGLHELSSYIDLEGKISQADTWTPIRDHTQLPQDTELCEQQRMAMMPPT